MGDRICHVITGLPRAGAQTVLFDLLTHRDASRYEATVVSLLARDTMVDDIEALGVPVYCANMGRNLALGWRWAKLAAHLRAIKPDLVHTWMYHGDVIGGLTAKGMAWSVPVVWHLHHSTKDVDKRSTRALAACAAPLSRVVPARIIACAHTSKTVHVERGYDASKMVVIANGVDAERYRPRPAGPRPLVRQLGLTEPVKLIGLAARFHPQKDHVNFLNAAQILAAQRNDVHFVLCGAGVVAAEPTFFDAARSDRIHLLGDRADLDQLLPQFDLSGLSSVSGEACSLVLLESMASGVPCVTTDVGDSARLVGDTGRVVRPKDPEALAAAWQDLLNLAPEQRAALGARARARAVEQYSLTRTASAIEAVYADVLESR